MPAQHSTQYPLDGLTIEQFVVLLLEACHRLGWVMTTEGDAIVLLVPRSAFSNGEKVPIYINEGIAAIESKNAQWQIGGKKKNAQNLVVLKTTLDTLKEQYTPEELTEKYNIAATEEAAKEKDLEERMQSGNLTATEKITTSYGGIKVTITLIALNVLVFIAMAATGAGLFEFDVDALYKWGGNVRDLTANGEWYRLITNIFLHGGLIHVAFNMYALFYVGIYLEPLLGRWRYLALYLACGVLASLTSIWWSGDRISVGASGAIFGLYGVFLALLTTNFLDKGVRKAMLGSIAIFVVFNLAYGTKGGIDNAAHIGGLLSGGIFGYAYYFVFSRKKETIVYITSICIITLALVYFVLPSVNNRPKGDIEKYTEAITRFSALEDEALAPLKKVNDTLFSPGLGRDFNNISLPAWHQCRLLLDSTDSYKLDEAIVKQITMLKKYIDLRIIQAQLYARREIEETNSYNDSLNTTGNGIQKILDSLNSENK